MTSPTAFPDMPLSEDAEESRPLVGATANIVLLLSLAGVVCACTACAYVVARRAARAPLTSNRMISTPAVESPRPEAAVGAEGAIAACERGSQDQTPEQPESDRTGRQQNETSSPVSTAPVAPGAEEEDAAEAKKGENYGSAISQPQRPGYDPDWWHFARLPAEWPGRLGELNNRGPNLLTVKNDTPYPARIGIRNNELGYTIGREFYVLAESDKTINVPNSWCWVVVQLASKPSELHTTKTFRFWRGDWIVVTIADRLATRRK